MRMLADGPYGDPRDEYMCISESTTTDRTFKFCRVTMEKFGAHYLRLPNEVETDGITTQNATREFPEMLESINCMHQSLNNFPFVWKCLDKGHHSCREVLESVGDQNLWICLFRHSGITQWTSTCATFSDVCETS
jgi:hypothetical protein